MSRSRYAEQGKDQTAIQRLTLDPSPTHTQSRPTTRGSDKTLRTCPNENEKTPMQSVSLPQTTSLSIPSHTTQTQNLNLRRPRFGPPRKNQIMCILLFYLLNFPPLPEKEEPPLSPLVFSFLKNSESEVRIQNLEARKEKKGEGSRNLETSVFRDDRVGLGWFSGCMGSSYVYVCVCLCLFVFACGVIDRVFDDRKR